MNFASSKLSKRATFAVLIVLFLALIVINNLTLRGFRLDLTENRIYTLSQGTRNILKNIREPITLYLFFSEKASKDLPSVRNYYTRVKEVLEEYRHYSDGKLDVKYVDPEPFSEEEDRATQLGIQAVKIRGGEPLYFGLAGTNAVDDIEVIPFFQQEKEVFLDYELGKLIYGLSRLKKPVLGLMTTLNMYPTRLDPQTGRMNDPWILTEQLEQLFDVRLVHVDQEKIGDDVDVLVVVHPKSLAEKTVYAIDQFIMRGGKGLFFVDPVANSEFIPTPQDQPMQDAKAKSSSLNRLFKPWGFTVDEETVIGDGGRALAVGLSTGGNAKHLAVIASQPSDYSKDDVVMDGLQSINFAMASHVRLNNPDDAAVVLEPLVQTSRKAMPISIQRFRFNVHPDHLRQGFSATGEQYALAARIRGPLKSTFKEPPRDEEGEDETAGDAAQQAHLDATEQQAELVVVADTDVLTDQMWARTSDFFGQRLITPIASNRDFVINLVENLFGNTDLINIRSRASYSRPFTRVEAIEQRADRRFREAEKKLRQELNTIDNRLRELQQKRTDKQQATLFTAEQQKELRLAREKKVKVRKELRNVRHQQVKDIERLGTQLKIVNIGVVPAVVVIAALMIGLLRVRRRRTGAAP